jgi:hypothetical protein
LGAKKLSSATIADGKGNLFEIDSKNIITMKPEEQRNPTRPSRNSRRLCRSVRRLSRRS